MLNQIGSCSNSEWNIRLALITGLRATRSRVMKRDKNVVTKCFRDLSVIVRSTRSCWRFCVLVEMNTENARDRATKQNRTRATAWKTEEKGGGTKSREIPLISMYESIGLKGKGGIQQTSRRQTYNDGESKWREVKQDWRDSNFTKTKRVYMEIKRREWNLVPWNDLCSKCLAHSRLTAAPMKTMNKEVIKERKVSSWPVHSGGGQLFLIPFSSSVVNLVMAGINQLAPTTPSSCFPFFFFLFFFSLITVLDTGTAVPNGPVMKDAIPPLVSAYFQHHVPTGSAASRGLAKLWTRQSEYYFCGEATLCNGTRSEEGTTRLTKRDSCYEFSSKMKNSWTAERVAVLLCLTLFTIPFEERLKIETSEINESVSEQMFHTFFAILHEIMLILNFIKKVNFECTTQN